MSGSRPGPQDYYGKRVAIATGEGASHILDITDGQNRPAGWVRGELRYTSEALNLDVRV